MKSTLSPQTYRGTQYYFFRKAMLEGESDFPGKFGKKRFSPVLSQKLTSDSERKGEEDCAGLDLPIQVLVIFYELDFSSDFK